MWNLDESEKDNVYGFKSQETSTFKKVDSIEHKIIQINRSGKEKHADQRRERQIVKVMGWKLNNPSSLWARQCMKKQETLCALDLENVSESNQTMSGPIPASSW